MQGAAPPPLSSFAHPPPPTLRAAVAGIPLGQVAAPGSCGEGGRGGGWARQSDDARAAFPGRQHTPVGTPRAGGEAGEPPPHPQRPHSLLNAPGATRAFTGGSTAGVAIGDGRQTGQWRLPVGAAAAASLGSGGRQPWQRWSFIAEAAPAAATGAGGGGNGRAGWPPEGWGTKTVRGGVEDGHAGMLGRRPAAAAGGMPVAAVGGVTRPMKGCAHSRLAVRHGSPPCADKAGPPHSPTVQQHGCARSQRSVSSGGSAHGVRLNYTSRGEVNRHGSCGSSTSLHEPSRTVRTVRTGTGLNCSPELDRAGPPCAALSPARAATTHGLGLG